MPSPVVAPPPASSLAALRTAYEAGTFTRAAYCGEIWPLHARLFDYSSFLADTNVAAIEINDHGVVFQLRDPSLKLWATANDQRHVAIASLNFRNYESDEVATVLRLAKVCSVIFDIGANVGFYSVALGQRFPDARILAFEPVPPTFAELQRNLALNSIHNVQTFNLGLSDRSQTLTFYFDPTVSGAASGAPLGTEFAVTQTLSCPVETLDDFTARTGVFPDFIKCDVEGGELNVFRGAAHMLERCQPIIFTEMLRKWSARFGYHPNDILAFFKPLGYQCFVFRDGFLQPFPQMTDQTVETNFFFLHTQRHLEMVRFLGLLK